MHRCIASTPLHYDSYIAIFIISAAHRCPRLRLTSIVFFLLVFFPFFLSPPPPVFSREGLFFFGKSLPVDSRPLGAHLENVALCRAMPGSLNGELTRGDPSGCPLLRDADSRGLTRRRGERCIVTFNLCFHRHCHWCNRNNTALQFSFVDPLFLSSLRLIFSRRLFLSNYFIRSFIIEIIF